MDLLLADLLLILHALLVLFVLLLPLAVLSGWPRWTRRPGWRITHLLLLAFIVAESWVGYVCPLTTWEHALRIRAGQAGYTAQGWLADWLHQLLFFQAPDWVFTCAYTTFLALVLWGFWRVPLRRASPPA